MNFKTKRDRINKLLTVLQAAALIAVGDLVFLLVCYLEFTR